MNQAVASIIRSKINGLDFVDKIAGLVSVQSMIVKDGDNNVTKTYPVACCTTADDCKSGAYNDLCPDSKYKTVIHFEDGGVSFERSESHWKYYKSTLKLVCWINVAKILDHDCNEGTACTLSSRLIAEIIRCLPEFPEHHYSLKHFHAEVTGQEVRSSSIFSSYTYNEKQVQYLMYPYDYFALTIESSFAICTSGTGVYDSTCFSNWDEQWYTLKSGDIWYRREINEDDGYFQLTYSSDAGVTWDTLMTLAITESSIIIDLAHIYHHRIVGTEYRIDVFLTPIGYTGVQGVDWENLFST